ncbi:MAG TPA: hypothetical protein VFF53_11320, partial [Geobacteraceae bacterium]|nr:hypothetical protein [Geobacteraceae bacterium]
MKHILRCLFILSFTALLGCSIAPEKPITRQDLYRSNLFSEFTIKDSPESILATLNRDGEAVVEGKTRFGDEYYIKLLATS